MRPHRLTPVLALLLCLVHVAAANAAGRFEHGLLWRVEAPGAPPSHLFGTLHSGDERVLDQPPVVREALDAAHSVAIELRDDEASVRSFRRAMTRREALLPEVLGEADYARIEALLAEAGIPPKARPHFTPWAALLVLIQPRGALGIQLDKLLLMEARAAHKPIHALETIDEQIDAFAGMAPDTQLALLRHAERHYDEIQLAVRPMIKAYLARDLRAMFRLNAETMAGNADIDAHNQVFLERVLYARNERFAERLAPRLREGGVFALFGALHLYGERGVLALLEKRGFRVRRVR